MIRVGDYQPVAGRVGLYLARVGERSRGLAVRLELEWQELAIYLPQPVELPDHVADQFIERFQLELALVLPDDLALRVDEHQRGPCPDGIAPPDGEVAIVHDGVLDAVAHHGIADIRSLLLVRELRGVNADHDQ